MKHKKFNFNNVEKFYLDILTYFSKNLGRYPIVKIDNPEQFFFEKIKKSSKKKRKISFIVESDYIVINRIKDILLYKLNNI